MYTAMISPRKYMQGRNVIQELGAQVQPLGQRALVMSDKVVWDLVRDSVSASLNEHDIEMRYDPFTGECSLNEIERVRKIGDEATVDVVIGIGGGKVIDAAKAVGARLECNWVIVPTVASTDAPTSALSVIYTDGGIFEKYEFHPKNPDLVLVDSALIVNAPARFLCAGIGDGLSTWVEARANLESRKAAMAGGVATHAAATLAQLCWDTLFTYGVAAIQAVERKAVTPAVEATIEAATLLSGLGFESAGLAAAHAIHNGITTLHEQTHNIMHGEKVAFGTLTQLVLEGRPTSEINEFIAFCRSVRLPTTLRELNLADVSREQLMQVAEAACAEGETIHNMPFPVTPDMVLDAMRVADAHGEQA